MECPFCGFHLINPGDRCVRCRKPLAESSPKPEPGRGRNAAREIAEPAARAVRAM